MNKDINIPLSDEVESFKTTDANSKTIKIFKLPSIGISELDASNLYTKVDSITLIFHLKVNITFSFYLIDEFYKSISDICKGT